MYGRAFESMYEGSMYGAGVAVFAVWGYVIAKARDGVIELNPKKLADTLGGTVKEIEDAVEFLAKPDPRSRCKESGGRRLVKEGEYQYSVPSWKIYREIRNEEQRREQNRRAQARHREKQAAAAGRDRKAGVKAGVDHEAYPTSTEQAMEMHDRPSAVAR